MRPSPHPRPPVVLLVFVLAYVAYWLWLLRRVLQDHRALPWHKYRCGRCVVEGCGASWRQLASAGVSIPDSVAHRVPCPSFRRCLPRPARVQGHAYLCSHPGPCAGAGHQCRHFVNHLPQPGERVGPPCIQSAAWSHHAPTALLCCVFTAHARGCCVCPLIFHPHPHPPAPLDRCPPSRTTAGP